MFSARVIKEIVPDAKKPQESQNYSIVILPPRFFNGLHPVREILVE